MNDKFQIILDSPAFKKLIIKKWVISLILTLMLSVYFGFIITVALDKTFFSTLIADNVTLAIPVGIGIIIFAWLMTGVYTLYANHIYDKEVEEIKKQL